MIVIIVLGWVMAGIISYHVAFALLFGIMDTAYNIAIRGWTLAWFKPKYAWYIISHPWVAAWGRTIGDWDYCFDSSSSNGWTFKPPFKVYRNRSHKKGGR